VATLLTLLHLRMNRLEMTSREEDDVYDCTRGSTSGSESKQATKSGATREISQLRESLLQLCGQFFDAKSPDPLILISKAQTSSSGPCLSYVNTGLLKKDKLQRGRCSIWDK